MEYCLAIALSKFYRSVGLLHLAGCPERPKFELFDLEKDPWETRNLAEHPTYTEDLELLKKKLHAFQERTNDPWILKWEYD